MLTKDENVNKSDGVKEVLVSWTLLIFPYILLFGAVWLIDYLFI